jgi:hypothetical protein
VEHTLYIESGKKKPATEVVVWELQQEILKGIEEVTVTKESSQRNPLQQPRWLPNHPKKLI